MQDIYLFIINNWVGWLFSILSVVIGFLYGKVSYAIKKTTAMEDGVRALLRNDIIKAYNKCLEKEYCPIYEMENIEEMYKQYHALGGNGTVTELVERVRELPTQPPKHHR